MRSIFLALALLTVPAFAQSIDAGSVDVVLDAGKVYVDAGDYSQLVGTDGGVAISGNLDNTGELLQMFATSVKSGNGWLIAAVIVAIFVSLLRTAVKKLHDWLPDDNAIDKILFYVYDTKIGGWVLNWLTSIAGGLLSAMSFGWEINGALWLKVLGVSTGASALFELAKDIWEAVQKAIQKSKDAKAAAAATPPEAPKS